MCHKLHWNSGFMLLSKGKQEKETVKGLPSYAPESDLHSSVILQFSNFEKQKKFLQKKKSNLKQNTWNWCKTKLVGDPRGQTQERSKEFLGLLGRWFEICYNRQLRSELVPPVVLKEMYKWMRYLESFCHGLGEGWLNRGLLQDLVPGWIWWQEKALRGDCEISSLGN